MTSPRGDFLDFAERAWVSDSRMRFQAMHVDGALDTYDAFELSVKVERACILRIVMPR